LFLSVRLPTVSHNRGVARPWSVIRDTMMVACLSSGSSPGAGSVEVGPVQCHHDGAACTDDVGHPANEDIVDVLWRNGDDIAQAFQPPLEVGGGARLVDPA
jgi:hypothetical protein